jgi:CubicO group peptidase (beta-lactamase class C family)
VNVAPGERANSNNGYRILARVIEVAGGGEFDGSVRELVFEPRRMGETVFGGNSAQPMARRATGYVPGPGWRTLRKDAPWDFANSRGAASWFTTASDLLRFLATLPLEPGDLHDAPGATPDGPFRRVAGHDGFGSGFANLAYLYPDAKTRLVLLGNIQSGLFMSLEKDVRALLAGQAVTGPVIERPPALPPSDRWRDYAGAYDLRPGAPMVIRRAGDHLEVSAGEAFYPLVATAPNAFFMRLRYARLTFPSAGPVDRVDWDEGGSRYSLKKLA